MTISFSRLGSHGGVGNCLFQIAGVLGLAEKYGAQAALPPWRGEQYFIDPLSHPETDKSIISAVKEKHYHYHDWQLTGDSDLLGYLQSAKYFPKDYKPKFKEEFLQPLKNHEAFKKETIGIHIRRNDYVDNKVYFQLPIHWFISTLISIEGWQDKNIVIISDDLAYCRIHFECLKNVYFMEGNDIEDLAAFSLCDTQILSNSSFSWWGCYLSEKQMGIHSGELFRGDYASNDIKDFYLPSWILHPIKKLDLTDTTFTIPVFFDHKDRKQNLDLCVCMLQSSFDTNIIVGEQGGSKFEYMQAWCRYMNFNLENFHRTKMLNDMAMVSDTPFIANWDADVIISPMQIYLAVLKLREGADVVFPYDGRFARLPRELWFKPIEKMLDIGAIGDTEPKGKRGRPVPESSVGGAVFFNKESFIDGGMENEYMISFGPEDCERNDRFTKLGFKVERVCKLGTGLGGCLYHIDHFCGPDSSTRNPFFRANHVELEKGRAMSKDDLRLYVDSFPWRHKYTESYYKRISEESIKSAKEIYEAIGFTKGSVIDIGAGIGEFHNNNPDYIAVDWNIPLKSLLIPKERFINIDLETDIVKPEKKYDLCLSLEVFEHISEGRADILVAMLCRLSDTILFSAAVPSQGGTGHINEQFQTYWEKKFNDNGFGAAIRQPDIKNNDKIELYYRQNIVLYVRGGNGKVSDFILPEYYQQIVKNLKNQLEVKEAVTVNL